MIYTAGAMALYFSQVCLLSAVDGESANIVAGWKGKQADIYFVIDSATGIWITDYKESVLKFVSDLVAEMDIGPSLTRVGVGVFSDLHVLHIPVNNTLSKEKLREDILKAPFLGGSTYLSRALEGVRKQGLPDHVIRPGVTHMGILITDGMSRHKQLTYDNATLLKQANAFLCTLGIGRGTDKNELKDIASDPKATFNFHVDNFDQLSGLRTYVSQKLSAVEIRPQGDNGTCGKNSKADVVFIYDQSALGEQDTKHVTAFINRLVQDFSIDTGQVRVGLVSKTCQEGDTHLGEYLYKEEFLATLNNQPGPDISELVKRARMELFVPDNGARLNSQHRMVIFLHDEVKNRPETMRQVSRAKFSNIQIFVIQLGSNYEKDFIHGLASKKENVIFVDAPNKLNSNAVDFLRNFCQDL